MIWPRLAAMYADRTGSTMRDGWGATFRDLQWLLNWRSVEASNASTRFDHDRIAGMEEHLRSIGVDV